MLIRHSFGDVRQLDKWSLEILGGVLAEDTELGVICIQVVFDVGWNYSERMHQ